MNLNHAYALVLIVLGVSGVSMIVHNVESAPPPTFLYIRADGSIDPPAQQCIESLDNITYTFKTDMYASIIVERSNITIDGNWHTVEGGYLPIPGLNLTRVGNVTVNNANIKRFDTGIYLESASQCVVSANNLTENNSAGILLISSSLNNISQNTITYNSLGIKLEEQSHSNTISQNRIADNNDGGIDVSSVGLLQENNILLGNDLKDNEWGIHFLGTFNCTITRNDIANNTQGIIIYRSQYITITENNIAGNSNHGIYLDMSYDGKIYHNNFVGNGPPYLYSSTNMWDNGYPSGGNYWSDYNGTDSNYDGIGDTPYVINSNNADNYPLMSEYIIPEFQAFLILPLFMIATLLGVLVYRRKLRIVKLN